MLTLLINLDASGPRLSAAAAQLEAAGLSWERLPAVDGRDRAPESFAGYDGPSVRRAWGRDLSGGEIGCYLSHFAALDRFLASDQTLLLVLEDDFRLRADAPAAIRAIAAAHASGALGDWSVANLSRRPRKFFTPLTAIPGGVLGRAAYFPTLTTALMWTRAGAAAFAADRTIRGPIDEILRNRFSRCGGGLACRPPPVPPAPGASLLHPDIPRPHMPTRARLRRQARNYPAALAHWLRDRARPKL